MRIIRNDLGGITVVMPLEDLLELLRLEQRLYRLNSGNYIWLYDKGLIPKGAEMVATPVDFLQEFPTLCDEQNTAMTARLSL